MITNTHLYREIHEQPRVVARLLEEQRSNMDALAAAIGGRRITHVIIAARGTSDNAARYAKYVLGAHNRLPVALAAPSLFTLYRRPPRLDNALVLGISQSGRSPDIVAVLAEARRQGALTAVFTNDVGSALAQAGEWVIDLCAGVERAVAATKTYTAELAAIALLSAVLAGDGQQLADLTRVPEAMTEILELNGAVSAAAPRYRYMEHCVVIGRGYNYATAYEQALKLKELTYTIVEPYSSADFQHGPMAMLEPGFPVIVLAPRGAVLDDLLGFTAQLGSRGGELIVVSDDAAALKAARVPFRLSRTVPEWLSPLTAIVPGQLFALHLAHARDYDVDAPRGLHKVTETR